MIQMKKRGIEDIPRGDGMRTLKPSKRGRNEKRHSTGERKTPGKR